MEENLKVQINEICKANQMPVIFTKELEQEKILYVDEQRVLRAIMNIVHNAIAHTNGEKGIQVKIFSDEKKVYYEIRDFGPGFSREALIHCKEQFFTEDKARSGVHYGLGMYFANEVAMESGGELTIQNLEDGALVTFSVAQKDL